MQVLPLREEVREARERSDAAERAMNLSQQAGVALTALSVVERQLAELDYPEFDLPGDAVIDRAIADYPELAGLADIAPTPDMAPSRRLEQRRLQLRTVDQFLRPIAATLEERSMEVHELQHQQFKLLQQPEYAELREELDRRNDIRRKGTLTMSRLRTRRQSLLPAEKAVDDFLPQAETELAHREEGINRELARARLHTLVETLDTTARTMGLEVPLPDPHSLAADDCPDAVLQEAVEALRALREAARAEAEILDEEMERVQAEIDEATAWMLERTG